MFERETVEMLDELTGLTLRDLDRIGSYELMLLCKQQEIEQLENEIQQMKDAEYLLVEKKFEIAAKGSEEYKELSNAEKRAIYMKESLRASKRFSELTTDCSKVKHEAMIMKVAIESLKRKNEREIKGLEFI